MYAFGPIEDVVPPHLRRRDMPTDPNGFLPPHTKRDTNVWFTMPNTGAATHFDTSDNLHVVLFGRKNFTLLPPSAAEQIGLYPALHPYCRQLQPQGTVRSHGGALPPSPVSPGAVHISARVGEVVFVPAYWFHTVTTVGSGAAIALNLWLPSSSHTAMEKAFTEPIPFESEWDDQTMRAAGVVYFNLLLGASFSLSGADAHAAAVRAALKRRYRMFDANATGSSHDGVHAQACGHAPPPGIIFGERALEPQIITIPPVPCLQHADVGAGLCLSLSLFLSLCVCCYHTKGVRCEASHRCRGPAIVNLMFGGILALWWCGAVVFLVVWRCGAIDWPVSVSLCSATATDTNTGQSIALRARLKAKVQSISNSNIAPLFVKMAQNLDLRCVLVPAPWVLGPKHVSNPY